MLLIKPKLGHLSEQIDFSAGITTTDITADKICIGSNCRTSFNKAVYSITNSYCDGVVGSLTTSPTCLTKPCTGTNNCGISYTYYGYYQCDGDCGFCCFGSCEGINSCPNTPQGYLVN